MLTDNDFKKLLDHFDRPWRGFIKVRKGVMKRIRKHITSLHCKSVSEYITLLNSNQREEETLQHLLKLTISRFYRDRYLWDHLTYHIIPSLLQHTNKINIWSAGCSCGEEVYSLKILYNLHFPSSPALNILATDSNARCLERAQNGIYQKSSLKELSEDTISQCFVRSQSRNEYAILPEFKETIVWQQHDILSNPPDNKFHIILLRNNLLTYYNKTVQSVALNKILKTVTQGGYLITGSHETLPSLDFPLVRSQKCKMIHKTG